MSYISIKREWNESQNGVLQSAPPVDKQQYWEDLKPTLKYSEPAIYVELTASGLKWPTF